jgi:hypothetical protein
MAGAQSQHRKGIALVVAAAVAWSTAPFFTRLLSFDSWSILFWRGLFGAAMIAAILVLLAGLERPARIHADGQKRLLVASLSAVGMVCFIPCLQLTSVSNVAIILATGPSSPLHSPGSGFGKCRSYGLRWQVSWHSSASRSSSTAPGPGPTFSVSRWPSS